MRFPLLRDAYPIQSGSWRIVTLNFPRQDRARNVSIKIGQGLDILHDTLYRHAFEGLEVACA